MSENYQRYIVVKNCNALWYCCLAALMPMVSVHHCSSATIAYSGGHVTSSVCPSVDGRRRPVKARS